MLSALPNRLLQNYAQKLERATHRRVLAVLGKLLITALTLGLLYHSVFTTPDTAAAWRGLLTSALTGAGRGPVLLALALVPLIVRVQGSRPHFRLSIGRDGGSTCASSRPAA